MKGNPRRAQLGNLYLASGCGGRNGVMRRVLFAEAEYDTAMAAPAKRVVV